MPVIIIFISCLLYFGCNLVLFFRFFDREEKLELDIDAKKVYYPKRWFGKKKKPRKVDTDYIPPEIRPKYRGNA